MTSYIYLSSDTQLLTSELDDAMIHENQTTVYFSATSIKSFFFEDNFDSKSQSIFSYSKCFSQAKYQVTSINLHLPAEHCKHLKLQNKKALRELFNYLVNHFENTQATYVEILFCSNGSENEPPLQEKLVTYEWLSVDDLYYGERKFMRIDTQMTEFVFRRRIA